MTWNWLSWTKSTELNAQFHFGSIHLLHSMGPIIVEWSACWQQTSCIKISCDLRKWPTTDERSIQTLVYDNCLSFRLCSHCSCVCVCARSFVLSLDPSNENINKVAGNLHIQSKLLGQRFTNILSFWTEWEALASQFVLMQQFDGRSLKGWNCWLWLKLTADSSVVADCVSWDYM